MVRLAVRVEVESAGRAATVRVARGLLPALQLAPGRHVLSFGTRRVRARVEEDAGLAPGRVVVPAPVAQRLVLPGALRTSIQRHEEGEIAFGPLIGLMVAPRVLDRLRGDGLRPPFTAYARYARELGAVLCVFTAGDVDPRESAIAGYRPETGPGGSWSLLPGRFPVPRVVLRRVFSHEGLESDPFTARAPGAGCTVLRIGRITQLEGLSMAARDPDLAPLIPWTRRLGPDTLAAALNQLQDLFVKPDLPSGGDGLYRLTRQRQGWRLTRWTPDGPGERWLPDDGAVREALAPLLTAPAVHLVQESLPLATYLGNPFDLFALVQRDGRGQWDVSALLARIAAPGRAITSPGAGGWVAPAEAALRQAFPRRWSDLAQDVGRVARAAAQAVDRAGGPRYEVGVQLALLPDGTVRLVQVDGEPRAEHVTRVHDPYAAQRIHRCPVYCAAGLAVRWAHGPLPPAGPPA